MFISVVMAVYNGELYLMEAVQGVLNQTYSNFELIIVNDGSTDRTAEILNSIDDSRVKVIHSENNRGAATSLNIGIEHAKGEWIAIHDADDISEPIKLEEQAKYLQDNPSSIGVGSLIKTIPGNEHVSDFSYLKAEEDYYNRIFSTNEVYSDRLFSCYLCHGTVIFSKEIFYKVGRYNPKYKISYDYDLWVRMFNVRPIEKVSQILYNYRIVQNSLGKKDTSQTIAELMDISTNSIYRYFRTTLNKEPHFAIIGSKKGNLFFRKNVEAKNNYPSVCYFSSYRFSQLEEVYKLYKEGEIDAVIVLNSPKSNSWIQPLLNRGLIWNVNLFKIWNYRY